MRTYLLVAFTTAGAIAAAQTPPVQPNLTPIPLPPGVTIPGPPQDVVGKPITATEAAEIALRNQPSIEISRAQILAAQGRTQQAKSNLLPNGTINAGYSRFQSFRTSGNGSGGSTSSTGFTSSVTLQQLLFDFNHTVDTVRQASNLETVARQNLTAAQSDLIFSVKQAYYTYVQNEELIKVQESNLSSSQAQLALAQARLTSGLGAPADVLQAATDVGSASQQLAQARQTALNSQIDLALDMGIDPRTPIGVADSQEPPPASEDVNVLVTTALSQRPEIKSAQASIRAAGYELSAARTVSAPSIGVTASAGSRGPDDPFATSNGSIGVALNWNFIDGGFAAGATKSAQADVQISLANLKQASLNAVNDVSQAFVNLKSSEQRVSIAQSQVANATESVRLAEGRFRAGVATFLEVTTAQAALVLAQSELVNAQSQVQQGRAQLLHAIGASVITPMGASGRVAVKDPSKKG
jgi:outer membrane protein